MDQTTLIATALEQHPIVAAGAQLPLPPDFVRALGYTGEARYLSAYWQPGTDDVVIDDGRTSRGGEWHAFILYTNHMAHQFGDAQLGNSEVPNRDRLLIDRVAPKLTIVSEDAARLVIRSQWPAVDASAARMIHTAEELYAMEIAYFAERAQQQTPQAIRRAKSAQEQRELRLRDWLKAYRLGARA